MKKTTLFLFTSLAVLVMMTTNVGAYAKTKSYNAAIYSPGGAKVITAVINDAGYSHWQDAGAAVKDAAGFTAAISLDANKAKNAGSSWVWQTTKDYNTSATNAVSDAKHSTTGINATSPNLLSLPPSAVAISPAIIAKEAANTDVITASMPPGVTIAKDESAGTNTTNTQPDATSNPPDKDGHNLNITAVIYVTEKSTDAAGFDLG